MCKYLIYKIKYIYGMIKKFNQFNEGLLDKMTGPSNEEAWGNIKDMVPNDMLISSAKAGIIDGVKQAIEQGANIYQNLGVVLRYAVESSNYELVKFLIGKGLYSYLSVGNYSILLYAVMSGNLEIVKYLIKIGKEGLKSNYQEMLKIAKNYNFEDIEDYLIYYVQQNGVK